METLQILMERSKEMPWRRNGRLLTFKMLSERELKLFDQILPSMRQFEVT